MTPRILLVVLAFLLCSGSAQAGVITSALEISEEAAAMSQWGGCQFDQDDAERHLAQARDELGSVSSPPTGGGHAATVNLIPIPDPTGLQGRLYIVSDVRPQPPFLGKSPKPA